MSVFKGNNFQFTFKKLNTNFKNKNQNNFKIWR